MESALTLFNYQAEKNPVYHEFTTQLRKLPGSVKTISDIPFLPVEFFRTRKIIIGDLAPAEVFESSRTTGSTVSRHYVHDRELYEESFLRGFRLFYGKPDDYFIGALFAVIYRP